MDLNNPQLVINKLETHADSIIRHCRLILPTISRIFLIGTFFEDGIRMWFQWADQRDYIGYHWEVPMLIGTLFVIFNLLAQLGGSLMVILRKKVRVACAILLSVVVIQTLAYNVLWSINFLLRNLSLVGCLALLFAETFESGRQVLFAGVPNLDNKRPQNWMQFIGRLLIVSMFLTVQSWELSLFYIFETIIACVLMFLVTIGWRTKLSALILAAYLFLMNFYMNAFWTLDYHSPTRDLYKYDFFQMFSIIGGLLMLINLGPGKVSLDHARRRL